MRNLMLREFNVIHIQCHTASKRQDPLRTILGPLAPFGMKRATEKSQGEGDVSELGSRGQGGELGVVGVFITWGCCNKIPQIYCRNVFSKFQRSEVHMKSSAESCSFWRLQGRILPGCFQLLVAPSGPWLVAASSFLRLHIAFFPVSLCVSYFCF